MQMQAGQAVQELPKNPSTKQAAMWKRHIPLSLVCLSVFVFILVCNLLTPLLVDDYTYCFSFVDGSPIESVWDIFPSIAAHAQKMNGRHAAHFTAQLFLFLPPVLFKIINAAVFVIGLCLITRIGGKVRPRPTVAFLHKLHFLFVRRKKAAWSPTPLFVFAISWCSYRSNPECG